MIKNYIRRLMIIFITMLLTAGIVTTAYADSTEKVVITATKPEKKKQTKNIIEDDDDAEYIRVETPTVTCVSTNNPWVWVITVPKKEAEKKGADKKKAEKQVKSSPSQNNISENKTPVDEPETEEQNIIAISYFDQVINNFLSQLSQDEATPSEGENKDTFMLSALLAATVILALCSLICNMLILLMLIIRNRNTSIP